MKRKRTLRPRRRPPLDHRSGFGQRGQSLSRKPKRRDPKPATPLSFREPCWLARFDTEHSCDYEGVPAQRAHLLKEQFLRDAIGLSMQERWAPCWWVSACSRHHRRLDNKLFYLRRADLPAGLEAAADEYPRAAARLTRDYGHRPTIMERAA